MLSIFLKYLEIFVFFVFFVDQSLVLKLSGHHQRILTASFGSRVIAGTGANLAKARC
jgi:hypothetical protein